MDSHQLDNSTVHELARGFEEATSHFYRWLSSLHRTLVCGVSQPLEAHEEAARSAFTQWCRSAENCGLRGFSELDGIGRSFERVARTAQSLAGTKLEGTAVTLAQYDTYLREQSSFVSHLAALRQILLGTAQRSDPLTSLELRAPFVMLVEKTHEAAVRGGSPYAVAIVGIDGFDGHAASLERDQLDALVKQIADTLLLELRRADTVCRYSGSQFGMLLAATEFSPAVEVCERIRATVDRAGAMLASEHPGVTVSIGIANWSRHAASIECLRRAESALASAEAAGSNRVVTWDPKASAG